MNDIIKTSKTIKTSDPAAKEINKKITKLHGIMKAGTLLAFEIGMLLEEKKNNTADKKEFIEWVKENILISHETVRKYIRLYEFFYDKPELLKELTLTEAYAEAGISERKALPAPCDDDDGKIYTAGLEDDDGSYDEELATIFNRKTRSGIKLENYRVEIYGEELWGFRRGMGRFPVADILFTRPAGLPEIEWQDMQKNVCMAFEAYYAKIEMYENNGKIDAPEDTRFGTMMENKGGYKK